MGEVHATSSHKHKSIAFTFPWDNSLPLRLGSLKYEEHGDEYAEKDREEKEGEKARDRKRRMEGRDNNNNNTLFTRTTKRHIYMAIDKTTVT